MRISDWSSDVCSSDLLALLPLLDHFHEFSKAVHDAVFDIVGGKPLVHLVEELASALDLGLFDLAQFHGGHGAFGLCHEVDVLDRAFLETDRPVRVVVARSDEHTSELQSLMRLS